MDGVLRDWNLLDLRRRAFATRRNTAIAASLLLGREPDPMVAHIDLGDHTYYKRQPPSPWHVGHGVEGMRPRPRHCWAT